MSKFPFVFSFSLLVCLGLGLVSPAAGQSSAAPNAPIPNAAITNAPEIPYLRALLEEMRLLRVTMQQMTGNTLRARILLEQLGRRQVRVETLSDEISQLKTLIAQAQDSQRGADELQEMETQIRECNDPPERARLLLAYNNYKRTLERERVALQKEAAEQQNKLQQAENTFRGEQAKLAELQAQLEKLDQELERLTTESKPRK